MLSPGYKETIIRSTMLDDTCRTVVIALNLRWVKTTYIRMYFISVDAGKLSSRLDDVLTSDDLTACLLNGHTPLTPAGMFLHCHSFKPGLRKQCREIIASYCSSWIGGNKLVDSFPPLQFQRSKWSLVQRLTKMSCMSRECKKHNSFSSCCSYHFRAVVGGVFVHQQQRQPG